MATQILNPAFRIDWQVNTNDVTAKILQMLENISAPIRSSSKVCKRRRRNRGRNKNGMVPVASAGGNGDRLQSEEPTASTASMKNPKGGTTPAFEDPKSTEFKDRVVLGISKILRLLENRALSIILFDRSFLHPSAIAQFIGSACINSGTHCTCLDGLSARLAPILNVRSASVIGVKKSVDGSASDAIDSVIDMVISSTKPVVMVALTDEEGDRKKNKKRKRARIDTGSGSKGYESVPYVEPTVSIQQRPKKKKK